MQVTRARVVPLPFLMCLIPLPSCVSTHVCSTSIALFSVSLLPPPSRFLRVRICMSRGIFSLLPRAAPNSPAPLLRTPPAHTAVRSHAQHQAGAARTHAHARDRVPCAHAARASSLYVVLAHTAERSDTAPQCQRCRGGEAPDRERGGRQGRRRGERRVGPRSPHPSHTLHPSFSCELLSMQVRARASSPGGRVVVRCVRLLRVCCGLSAPCCLLVWPHIRFRAQGYHSYTSHAGCHAMSPPAPFFQPRILKREREEVSMF